MNPVEDPGDPPGGGDGDNGDDDDSDDDDSDEPSSECDPSRDVVSVQITIFSLMWIIQHLLCLHR